MAKGIADTLQASLLLDKFREEEVRRLAEKADQMRRGVYDDRAAWANDFWRKKNVEILDAAIAILNT